MQIDLQVGMGSEHDVRETVALGGNADADAGSKACLPQGQWVTREGERGHGGGVDDGGWHGLVQMCSPQSNNL